MAQPSNRSALTPPTRVRRLELADPFELDLPRTTARGELVEALAPSERASFAKLLDALKRAELKDICRAHGRGGRGRRGHLPGCVQQPATSASRLCRAGGEKQP